MSDISHLYHPLILQHSKHPENFYVPEEFQEKLEAYNPLCGDKFWIYVMEEKGKIKRLAFSGYGCAVSKAATSLLLSKLASLDLTSATELVSNYLKSIENEGTDVDEELKIFQVAKKYPGREQCAILSAKALNDFLIDKKTT